MAVRNTREGIEVRLGDALKSRTQSLYLHSHGAGPPDLCWLEKIRESTLVPTSLQGENVGFFHHVVGLPVVSPAYITAYFSELIQSTAKRQWFETTGYRVVSGVYCCYDAFTGVDIRVEVRLPGQTSSYAVRSDGKREEVTEALWDRVFLSACARYVTTVPEIQCIKVLDMFEDKSIETMFLKRAAQHFGQGLALGCEDASLREADETQSRLSIAVFKYLMSRCRYEECMAFLSGLEKDYPGVVVLQASVHKALARPDQGLKDLASLALKDSPLRSYAMLKEAEILLELGKGGASVELAAAVVKAIPWYTDGWLALARGYLSIKEYEGCLVAINAAPMKDVHKSKPAGTLENTQQTEVVTLSEVIHTKVDDMANGVGYELHLPSQGLAPDVTKAYSVLVDLYRQVKWNGLLELRGRVFAMEFDSGKSQMSPKRKSADDTTGSLSGLEPPLRLRVNLECQDGIADKVAARESNVEIDGVKCASFNKSEKHKRLCMNWLDNLFHALYQDLNAVSSWVGEEKRGEKPIKSFGTWLALGDAARNLRMYAEAEISYRKCIAGKFSLRAYAGMLEMYGSTGHTKEALVAAEEVIRHYNEETQALAAKPPKDIPVVSENLSALISMYGYKHVVSVKDALQTPNLDSSNIFANMNRYNCHGMNR